MRELFLDEMKLIVACGARASERPLPEGMQRAPAERPSACSHSLAEDELGAAMLDASNRYLDGKSIFTGRERAKHFPSIIEL